MQTNEATELFNRNSLAMRPVVDSFAIAPSSLTYQFGEAAAKLNIQNFVDALSARTFILHQRVKLPF
jgi:cysteine sulfinate desulfinase/cysteine desulfurase-like protein